MVEKAVALDILQDIETQLNYDNWKSAKKTVDYYIKNLEISTDEKIKKLINKYTICVNKYGETSIKSIWLAKKINKKFSAIYNKNC